jgi:hypothetical protein
LKRREGFISGNPQSYVLYYKAIRGRSGWKLQALEEDEVITLPEEKHGWAQPSLTAMSRITVIFCPLQAFIT